MLPAPHRTYFPYLSLRFGRQPARGLKCSLRRMDRTECLRLDSNCWSLIFSSSHLSSFSHHPLPPNIIDSSPIRHRSCGRLVPGHSRIAQYKSFAYPDGRLLISLPLYLLLLSPAFAHTLHRFHTPSKSTELDGFDSSDTLYKTVRSLTHRHTSSVSPRTHTTYT